MLTGCHAWVHMHHHGHCNVGKKCHVLHVGVLVVIPMIALPLVTMVTLPLVTMVTLFTKVDMTQ